MQNLVTALVHLLMTNHPGAASHEVQMVYTPNSIKPAWEIHAHLGGHIEKLSEGATVEEALTKAISNEKAKVEERLAKAEREAKSLRDRLASLKL